MKRLREISRFECEIRVLRSGFCECTVHLAEPSSAEMLQGAKYLAVSSCQATFTKSRTLPSLNFHVIAYYWPVIVL